MRDAVRNAVEEREVGGQASPSGRDPAALHASGQISSSSERSFLSARPTRTGGVTCWSRLLLSLSSAQCPRPSERTVGTGRESVRILITGSLGYVAPSLISELRTRAHSIASQAYNGESERRVRWNDPVFAVDGPREPTVISDLYSGRLRGGYGKDGSRHPMFSIVTPVYRTPLEYLEACIASVEAQTFDDWELLLVDNGNEAEISDWLDQRATSDERLQVFHSSQNLGIAGLATWCEQGHRRVHRTAGP